MNNPKEHKNWLKVAHAILITQKGVAPMIETCMERWHKSLLLIPSLSTCGQCTCAGLRHCVRCKCTKRTRHSCGRSCVCKGAPPSCSYCAAWAAELESLRMYGGKINNTSWENSDWRNFEKEPWAVAKIFMSFLGARKVDVKDAVSTDLGNLMNLLEWCPFIIPPVVRNVAINVRDKVRNVWAHAATEELSDAQTTDAFKFLDDLLQDPAFKNDINCQQAYEELQQLFKEDLTCLRDTEFKAIKQLQDALGQDLEAWRHDCNEKGEMYLQKTNDLEMRINFIHDTMKERLAKTDSAIKLQDKKLRSQAACISELKFESKSKLDQKELESHAACLSEITNTKKKSLKSFGSSTKGKIPDFDSKKCQEELKNWYRETATAVPVTPWDFSINCSVKEVYTKLSWVKKIRNLKTESEQPLRHYVDLVKGSQHRLTVVEGLAGVGKSTFTKKLALDWADGTEDALRKYDFLLLIRLRDIEKEERFVDVLKSCIGTDDGEKAMQLYQYMKKTQEKCLLVLDGLDECVCPPCSEIVKIIKGQILRQCRVLVTTRPSAIQKLGGYMYGHYKIKGFDEGDIKKYAAKHFKTRAEEYGFVSYLMKSSLVCLAKIPILCMFLCLLWKARKEERFPRTRTELYREIYQSIIHHSNSRTGCVSRHSIDDYDSLLRKVGRVAYNALKKDCLLFHPSELSEIIATDDIQRLGLLATGRASTGRPVKSVEFLHKSLQEFAAAWYVAKCFEEKLSEKNMLLEDVHLSFHSSYLDDEDSDCGMFQCTFLDSEDMIRFICGLSPSAALAVFDKLSDIKQNVKPSNILPSIDEYHGPHNLCFLDLFNESKSDISVKDSFLSLCGEILIFGAKDLPSEDVIANLFHLGLKKIAICGIRPEHDRTGTECALTICRCLDVCLPPGEKTLSERGQCPLKSAFSFLEKLFKISETFTIGIVRDEIMILDMFDIYPEGFRRDLPPDSHEIVQEYPAGLRGFRFKGDIYDFDVPLLTGLRELRVECRKFLATNISSFSLLRRLELDFCTLVQYNLYLGAGLQHLSLLEELNLVNVTTECLNILAKHLDKISCLKMLKLQGGHHSISPGNFFGNLYGLPELIELCLEGITLSDETVAILAQHFSQWPYLGKLSLEHCHISASGVERLSSSLGNIPHLEFLNLSSNPLGAGLVSLASKLFCVPELTRLALSYVNMTDEGLVSLGNSLRHVPLLSEMRLDWNKGLSSESWGKFADQVHHLSRLEYLKALCCEVPERVQDEIRNAVPNTYTRFNL